MREVDRSHKNRIVRRVFVVFAMLIAMSGWCVGVMRAAAQENPLGQVQTHAPEEKHDPAAAAKPAEVTAAGTILPRSSIPRLRMEANLVLVPMTVTDGMNRLVTGLEAPNFEIFDNN